MILDELTESNNTEGWVQEFATDFVVATVLSDPYTMIKTDAVSEGRVGNDRYEGFAVDLINEIAKIVGFNFTIALANGYGSRRQDGSWTGMIGEIVEGRADMAIGDMRFLMNKIF